jgi:hypothetical protein
MVILLPSAHSNSQIPPPTSEAKNKCDARRAAKNWRMYPVALFELLQYCRQINKPIKIVPVLSNKFLPHLCSGDFGLTSEKWNKERKKT